MVIDYNNYSIKTRTLSDEHKAKISKARTGLKHSEETKKKIGDNNARYNLGRHLHEDVKRKISMSKRGVCGDWDGYTTPVNKKIRLSSEYTIWRENVFKRDNWTCQKINCQCCSNKKGANLHPHHILSFSKYEDERFNVDNGLTYCAEYHINSKELHKNIGGGEDFNKR